VQLINNCVLVPEVILLQRQRSTLPSILNHLRLVRRPQSMTVCWFPIRQATVRNLRGNVAARQIRAASSLASTAATAAGLRIE
jgi:hypothetical protein